MELNSSLTKGHRGELDTIIIENTFARLEMALFGAHILSYAPHKDNRDRLWLSPHADLSGNKPIRGGIPLCWPWFGNDSPKNETPLPSHGYLRNQVWSLLDSLETEQGTELKFVPGKTKFDAFNYDTDVMLTVCIGESLKVSLSTTNNGPNSFVFNAALHTYFSVDKVSNAVITNITGDYKDKLDNWAIKATPSPYNISAETDRIHLCQAAETNIQNGDTITHVGHEGHDSIVVWNPWMGAASMPDMDAFGYKNMLCIETALTQWHTLESGCTHVLTQEIS